jgi:glycyl-tRNA synthetase alpha subunit
MDEYINDELLQTPNKTVLTQKSSLNIIQPNRTISYMNRSKLLEDIRNISKHISLKPIDKKTTLNTPVLKTQGSNFSQLINALNDRRTFISKF